MGLEDAGCKYAVFPKVRVLGAGFCMVWWGKFGFVLTKFILVQDMGLTG